MSQFTMTSVTSGVVPPTTVDPTKGVVIAGISTSSATGTIYDDLQALIPPGSQPVDPKSHVTSLTIPASYTIPVNFLALTMLRWPVGNSAAPMVPYSALRSHDFYINPYNAGAGQNIAWWNLETSAGVWNNWGLFDAWALNCKWLGVIAVYVLEGTPTFYSGTTAVTGGDRLPAYVYTAGSFNREALKTGTAPLGNSSAPLDKTKWQAYVQAVCNRFVYLGLDLSKVCLEVWNEPHFNTGFSTYYYSGTAAELAEMTRITYRVAKSVSTNIRIISPAVSKIEATGRGEMVSMLDASAVGITVGGTDGTGTTAADWVEILGCHIYTQNDGAPFGFLQGASLFANVELVRSIRDAGGSRAQLAGRPIWATETGVINGSELSRRDRLRYIPRLLASCAAAGVEKAFFYAPDHLSGLGWLDAPEIPVRVISTLAQMYGKSPSYINATLDGRVWMKFTDGSSMTI